MEDVVDVRIHGRGGQGTVTLAALLVDAAFDAGWNSLGFPSFGTERTGAPVSSFVRMSKAPIRDRSEIRKPAVVIVQDATLIDSVDVLDGLGDGGILLLNAASSTKAPTGIRVSSIDATQLAVAHLGAAKTSTAMLGLFAAATSLIPMGSVAAAIQRRFKGQVARDNETLAQVAFAIASAAEGAA